jgi:hypothetical protein
MTAFPTLVVIGIFKGGQPRGLSAFWAHKSLKVTLDIGNESGFVAGDFFLKAHTCFGCMNLHRNMVFYAGLGKSNTILGTQPIPEGSDMPVLKSKKAVHAKIIGSFNFYA